MHAYVEDYLPRAMKNLGEAFDYALNAWKVPPSEFQARFVASSEAAEWESGSPRILVGISGTELVRQIFSERTDCPPPQRGDALSPEYWSGWALAYYHWWSARRFGEIFSAVPLEEVIGMYAPLHEESENRFVDRMEELMSERIDRSPLRRLRENRGLTQGELAAASGVNIRNVRHYEQDPASIARAEFATVSNLARALSCDIADLSVGIVANTK